MANIQGFDKGSFNAGIVSLQAFMDHRQASLTVNRDLEDARSRIAGLSDLGISLDTITKQLLDEGVAAFAKPFESLMSSIEGKRERLSGST